MAKKKKSANLTKISKPGTKKKFQYTPEDIFLKTLDVVKQALKENLSLPEMHLHRHKPIAQGLLNCSEILIQKGLHDKNVEKHYKILKEVEDMKFDECKNGFEIKQDKKLICYDLNDAKRYYRYLRGKYSKQKKKAGAAGRKKCMVKRKPGYLYFVDKDGDISRVKAGKKKSRQQKVCKCRIKKKKGFLYYVNSKGTVSKSRMKRGGKKRGNKYKKKKTTKSRKR